MAVTWGAWERNGAAAYYRESTPNGDQAIWLEWETTERDTWVGYVAADNRPDHASVRQEFGVHPMSAPPFDQATAWADGVLARGRIVNLP
jgi:hypothetical protein